MLIKLKIIQKVKNIDKKLNQNYKFQKFSIERWNSKYKPLINNLLKSELDKNDFDQIFNYLNTIEFDLVKTEKDNIQQLEDLMTEDYGSVPKYVTNIFTHF